MVLTSVCGLVSLRWVIQPDAPRSVGELSTDSYALPAAPVSRSGLAFTRPVYPYSVIPGGVESPEELKQAMARDPVVAAHFREFNLAAVRIVRLESSRFAYVSYRLHNDVFWTRKQLKLAAGEKVITDGTHSARARCGNRISALPHVETLPSEPSIQELETPQALELYSVQNQVLAFEAELPPSSEVPLFAAPLVTAGGARRLPVSDSLFPIVPGAALFPPPCVPSRARGGTERNPCGPAPCVPTRNHPCHHPSPVPEPATWLLLAPGLVYGLYRWRSCV